MSAQAKLDWITDKLDKGMTVYLSTAYKHFAFKAKHKAMLKVKGDSLYMQRGNKWDCVDYCRISAN